MRNLTFEKDRHFSAKCIDEGGCASEQVRSGGGNKNSVKFSTHSDWRTQPGEHHMPSLRGDRNWCLARHF